MKKLNQIMKRVRELAKPSRKKLIGLTVNQPKPHAWDYKPTATRRWRPFPIVLLLFSALTLFCCRAHAALYETAKQFESRQPVSVTAEPNGTFTILWQGTRGIHVGTFWRGKAIAESFQFNDKRAMTWKEIEPFLAVFKGYVRSVPVNTQEEYSMTLTSPNGKAHIDVRYFYGNSMLFIADRELCQAAGPRLTARPAPQPTATPYQSAIQYDNFVVNPSLPANMIELSPDSVEREDEFFKTKPTERPANIPDNWTLIEVWQKQAATMRFLGWAYMSAENIKRYHGGTFPAHDIVTPDMVATTTTPEKKDCILVAKENLARLAPISFWAKQLNYVYTVNGNKVELGHAVVVWKDKPDSQVNVIDANGSFALNTYSTDSKTILSAMANRYSQKYNLQVTLQGAFDGEQQQVAAAAADANSVAYKIGYAIGCVILYVTACGVFGLIGLAIGYRKNKPVTGFWLGFFFGFIGWIVAAILEKSPPAAPSWKQTATA
jgi:hypothetical protein